jgi:hypothetical protein
MPADDARCSAADPPPPQVPVAVDEININGGFLYLGKIGAPPAQAPAAGALQKVAPQPAQPAAKQGSLLGAIVDALGGDQDANNRRARAIEDQNLRNLEAQFRPQFQQLLYLELAFLRRVCKPDAKPFAEVAKAAKADLHVPLREYVSQYWARQSGRGSSNVADPRSAIRKLLVPLVAAKLGPEKARLYRQECDNRAEARKHAVVVNLVAALDLRLVLTAQQRAKLVQSLSANYENAWDQYVEAFAAGNQIGLPSIRDKSIVPLLDARQKSVWEQVVKLDGDEFFGDMDDSFQNALSGDSTEIQEIAGIAEGVQNGR